MSVPSRVRRPAGPSPSAVPGGSPTGLPDDGSRVDLDAVQDALSCHPDVEGVAVGTSVHDGRTHVVARVVARAMTAGRGGDHSDDRSVDPSDDREQVERWRSAYNAAYDETADADLGEDFGIWRDGDTGLPMPSADMHEWRDGTVARIRDLGPRRLLDVGAGTGLLLRGLAPHCERYHATDLSDSVVRRLRAQIAADPVLAGRVHVEQRAAADVRGLEPGSFDVVVLNSVVQYLPGAGHLEDVVRACFGLVAPGGHLFVGDVRNLALLRCSRVVAELARTDAGACPLVATTERDAAGELELPVDPDWFVRLAADLGAPCTVEAQLRRGRAHNEMTRYRYDVTLTRAAAVADPGPVLDLRWGDDVADVDALGSVLGTTRGAVRIAGVPNARLYREVAALRLLTAGGEPSAARRVLAGPGGGVEPEEFWALGERVGRDVRVRWSPAADGVPGTVEVVVAGTGTASPAPVVDERDRPLAGDPASGARDRALVADLRGRLAGLLPDDPAAVDVVLVSSLAPAAPRP